jgi:hypothetical protein
MLESKAAFARRKGWNRSTATRYAEAGKIVVTTDGLVDVEASERLLAQAKDPLKEGVRQRHQREPRRRDGGHDHGGSGGDRQSATRHARGSERHELPAADEAPRGRRGRARAELLRLELEEKEGRLVDAEVARKRTFQLARAGRDAVMNLRFRIDPLLAGESDPAKRAEIWDRETRQICEEIARASARRSSLAATSSEVEAVARTRSPGARCAAAERALARPTRAGSPAGRRIRASR